MRGHVGPAPPSAARTLAFALTSGLLVVGLAFEVAVATLNERPVVPAPANVPVHIPASCTHATQHQLAGPSRPKIADTSHRAHKGGICP